MAIIAPTDTASTSGQICKARREEKTVSWGKSVQGAAGVCCRDVSRTGAVRPVELLKSKACSIPKGARRSEMRCALELGGWYDIDLGLLLVH